MKIKPGSLCMIKGWLYRPEWDGKIVKAVRFMPDDVAIDRLGNLLAMPSWEVVANWLPPCQNRWSASPRWLIPLNDPDADLTEKDDALTDNLLDALQYTKEAA